MIEFLQQLEEAGKNSEEAAKEICQVPLSIQGLYSSYLLSLKKYLGDSGVLMKERE